MLFILIFFFNDTTTTEIYTLSLHDALPISSCILLAGVEEHGSLRRATGCWSLLSQIRLGLKMDAEDSGEIHVRSEEHTSELQSRQYLVCRLLLEKNTQFTLSSLTYPILIHI